MTYGTKRQPKVHFTADFSRQPTRQFATAICDVRLFPQRIRHSSPRPVSTPARSQASPARKRFVSAVPAYCFDFVWIFFCCFLTACMVIEVDGKSHYADPASG